MRSFRFGSALSLVLVLIGFGCYTSPTRVERTPLPAYTQASQHFRDFEDAEALAAYLHPGSEAGPLVSAHRGGPAPGYPENALQTFDRVLRYGPVLIECDVRMSQDSVLVLLHDDTLDRTTTGSGPVSEASLADLRTLLLRDPLGVITPFRLPTVREVLAWADGRTILTLDIKRDVPPEPVVALLDQMEAYDTAIVIVYSVDDLIRYAALSPDLLFSVSADTMEEAQAILDSGVDLRRLIVFTGVEDLNPEVIAFFEAQGVRTGIGTFRGTDDRARAGGPEVYARFLDAGIGLLSSDAPEIAVRATMQYAP